MKSTSLRTVALLFFVTLFTVGAQAQWYVNCNPEDFISIPQTFGCGGVAYNPSGNTITGGGTKTSGPFTITTPSSVPPGNNPITVSVVFDPSTYGEYTGNAQFSYSFYTLTVSVNAVYRSDERFIPRVSGHIHNLCGSRR